MATEKPITRNQLAKFLPDHETIKAFERLLRVTADLSPDQINNLTRIITETGYAAGVAENRAEARSMTPVVDYIDFTLRPKHVNIPARLTWNADDDTLNIHHTGDVTQQVGLEFYVRFANDSGATIPNGTVVGLDFVGGVTTDDVVPFISDGSVPMLNIVGVTTQDVLDGGTGRSTVFGVVRNIDTTGTPYGEVWAQGDVLYASPTISGGFTKVKPTAPAWCIPLALVLFADATFGQIFVRPTIDQPLYYAEFVKTTDTSPAIINTAYPLTFDAVNIANGLSIGAPASHIVAEFSGLYRFSISVQITSGSASTKQAWFWFRKNGVDIANSATKATVTGSSTTVAPSVDILISLDAADYVEVVWAADDTGVTLDTTPATAFAPQAPGVILVVSQEQQ